MIDTKRIYVRFIGHELRTPLNSVFMGLQLSIDQIPEDTQEPVEVERRETLVETQSACGAALDILNELLLFDKLETGALVLHKQSVPVTELVEDSVKMFSAQAREKSIELSITNNDEGMLEPSVECKSVVPLALCDTDEVSVDKNKVVQVIRNVVSNAIKFTPASGKIQVNLKFEPLPRQPREPADVYRAGVCCSRGRIVPGCGNPCDCISIDVLHTPDSRDIDTERQVSGELIIEVRDSGAGISEENQRRLFKEVVQFNPELLQNGGGSGLGMCICKNLMEAHGGGISMYSAGIGQGCLFTLRLPMTRSGITMQGGIYTPAAYVPTLPNTHSSTAVAPRPLVKPALETGDTSYPQKTSNKHAGGGSAYSPCWEAEDQHSVSSASGGGSIASSRSSVSSVVAEHPLRFLVVDDSKMNRKMLCRMLRKKGHECTEAEDGVQAVATMASSLVSQPSSHQSPDSVSAKISRAYAALTALISPRVAGLPAVSTVGHYDAILMDFM